MKRTITITIDSDDQAATFRSVGDGIANAIKGYEEAFPSANFITQPYRTTDGADFDYQTKPKPQPQGFVMKRSGTLTVPLAKRGSKSEE